MVNNIGFESLNITSTLLDILLKIGYSISLIIERSIIRFGCFRI
jgi:hypothetical protein